MHQRWWWRKRWQFTKRWRCSSNREIFRFCFDWWQENTMHFILWDLNMKIMPTRDGWLQSRLNDWNWCSVCLASLISLHSNGGCSECGFRRVHHRCRCECWMCLCESAEWHEHYSDKTPLVTFARTKMRSHTGSAPPGELVFIWKQNSQAPELHFVRLTSVEYGCGFFDALQLGDVKCTLYSNENLRSKIEWKSIWHFVYSANIIIAHHRVLWR